MPKLRHFALSSNDPIAAAEFYKQAFGMTEVARAGDPSKERATWGVHLSDGTVNLAILKFGWDQTKKGLDYVGPHHMGFLVEGDLDEWIRKLEDMGAECFVRRPDSPAPDAFFEIKFRGPDGTVFDITDKPWIGAQDLQGELALDHPRQKEKAKV
jgi:methylmalonyl-CoA/ethylmalonyl-CoA epimerase